MAPKKPQPSPKKPPAYRRRSGYDQAIVTLTDSATGKRRDYWLGEYGSPQSRELYYRLLADYESLGRRLPDKPDAAPGGRPTVDPDVQTVNNLVRDYWRRVARDFLPKRHNAIKSTIRLLRRMDGNTPLNDYGPRRLRLLREAMIAGDAAASPPRKPWSRTTVNDRVRIVVAMFRWGASQEMLPATAAAALATVEPLRRGRTRAAEARRVPPSARRCCGRRSRTSRRRCARWWSSSCLPARGRGRSSGSARGPDPRAPERAARRPPPRAQDRAP
ncbi:MAG: hypothetical protein HND58_09580 [Planctomycetota bacterium]|nr:MAG: hypothetical protein HND58_09580 [Planctomycetota bacterium]